MQPFIEEVGTVCCFLVRPVTNNCIKHKQTKINVGKHELICTLLNNVILHKKFPVEKTGRRTAGSHLAATDQSANIKVKFNNRLGLPNLSKGVLATEVRFVMEGITIY